MVRVLPYREVERVPAARDVSDRHRLRTTSSAAECGVFWSQWRVLRTRDEARRHTITANAPIVRCRRVGARHAEPTRALSGLVVLLRVELPAPALVRAAISARYSSVVKTRVDGVLSVGELVADRYSIERELGRGGMAIAYVVKDTRLDRTLALKRLLPSSPDAKKNHARFFEQEFLALQQLSHPRIVEVYDFRREQAGGAFYTMEWLDGGDLLELSPLPYKKLCVLLSDVASALSLLHSRRLVHRDVTPRNVRCSNDGHAKLIDFGAVAPYGPVAELVGTPPYLPPEAVMAEDLDGRADLYALGAIAYFALTGRHAYPARSLDVLQTMWEVPLQPPSHHAPDVPKALDTLILSLLSRDRNARPASAAEVMERLCTIGGLEVREQVVVRDAYLTTPRLVGRDREIARVRKMLRRTLASRGGAISIRGEEGVGRSRLLSHCLLEAKLLGVVSARVNALDTKGELGVAKELAKQVLQAIPTALESLLPAQRALFDAGILEESAPRTDGDADSQAISQGALLEFLLAASALRPLMLGVDDAQRIDERSAALMGLLAHEARTHRIALVAATRSDGAADPTPAMKFYEAAATAVELRPLTQEETGALLSSTFGDVANLQMLIDRLHDLASGRPALLMRLARHLVDRGSIRYEAGAWTLPEELDPHDLPPSLQAALEAQVAGLSGLGRRVAECLSLPSEVGLTFHELTTLLDASSPREVLAAVSELTTLGLAQVAGLHYRLSSDSLRRLVKASIDSAQARALNERLAAVFESRDSKGWLVVEHLLLAGCEQRALEVVVATARDLLKLTPREMLAVARALPRDWETHLRALLAFAERSGRPLAEIHLVRTALVGYAVTHGRAERADVEALLAQLAHDCGRDIYDSLDPTLPPQERVPRALALAQERYDRTDPTLRVMPPGEALPLLARNVIRAIGVMGPRYDYPFFRELTALEPFARLSPALTIVQWNVEGTRALSSGRLDVLIQRNTAILARMAEPDKAGLDEVAHRYMGLALMYSTSMSRTMLGQSLDEAQLAAMDADPLFAANACYLRMLAALYTGDIVAADGFKRRAELLRLRDCPPQMFEGAYLVREAWVYAFAGDLGRLKQLLPAIERMAEKVSGMIPVHLNCQGDYHRLRGSLSEAHDAYAEGLAMTKPGEHAFHCALATNYVLSLLLLDRATDARRLGEELLAETRATDPGPQIQVLLEVMARVHAHIGEHQTAVELAEESIALVEAMNSNGLVLGSAHETRAWVALKAGDQAGFERHARRCADVYRGGDKPLFTARYAALMATAEAPRISLHGDLADARTAVATRMIAQLSVDELAEPNARARAALHTLLTYTEAEGGFMYTLQSDGLQMAAREGTLRPPADLDTLVTAYLETEIDGGDEDTVSSPFDQEASSEAREGWEGPDGTRFAPLSLIHADKREVLMTGLLVVRRSDLSRISHELLTAISRTLHESGDAKTIQVG